MEEKRKNLTNYLSLIEEDRLEEKDESLEDLQRESALIEWDKFYSNLSQKDKDEWRRITILLIKTYDSDKTNQLFQMYKEILI
mmetsp:Transcript_30008/g.29255  ORF Transcript_30008/g.29255 Transcript_30008/m.29255 type:complete len:83 (+) Transcript_30008:112-360(+)